MARVHARAARVAGADLVGVVGVLPGVRRRRGRRARCAGAATPTSRQLLAEADVDVVHVCTPNDTHAPLAARRRSRPGEHVMCEKPLATSLADAAAMARGGRTSRRRARCPFVYRFHPMVREARARVRAGELGRLGPLHGSYLQDWLSRRQRRQLAGRPRAAAAPSRAFGDIGSHWCDLMEFVTGRPDRAAVGAARPRVQPQRGGRDGHAPRTS